MFESSMGGATCAASLSMLANLLAHGVAHMSLSDPRYGNQCLNVIDHIQERHAEIMKPKDAVSFTVQALGAVLERSQLACKYVIEKESE